ncbi:hypothetical protein QYF36_020594 [Acer negundo]|nr:hypothetical protein QYF36_020594 [Acer negundo]
MVFLRDEATETTPNTKQGELIIKGNNNEGDENQGEWLNLSLVFQFTSIRGPPERPQEGESSSQKISISENDDNDGRAHPYCYGPNTRRQAPFACAQANQRWNSNSSKV